MKTHKLVKMIFFQEIKKPECKFYKHFYFQKDCLICKSCNISLLRKLVFFVNKDNLLQLKLNFRDNSVCKTSPRSKRLIKRIKQFQDKTSQDARIIKYFYTNFYKFFFLLLYKLIIIYLKCKYRNKAHHKIELKSQINSNICLVINFLII